MRVTGVIPTYNHEKWVTQALDSMIEQTRPPNQIVVVDDCSTDNSYDVVMKYLQKPKNIPIHLIKLNKNSGPAAARNAAIRLTKDETDVYAFLDSDDLYLPTKIEKSLKKFENQVVGCVYSDYETFNGEFSIKNYKEFFSARRLYEECIVNCDSLVRKEAIYDVGLFPEDLRATEDYFVWRKLARKYLIVQIPELLLRIRIGLHSASHTLSKAQWEDCYRRMLQKEREGH